MLPAKQLEELRQFILLCQKSPSILHDSSLRFFKEYLISLGATIPKSEEKPSKVEEESLSPEMEDEDMESDVELDMTGVIEPDEEEPQEMGDSTKIEFTDEEMDSFDAKRSEAFKAFSDADWNKSVLLLTDAIKINGTSGAMFAKRGTCYLKMNKPNACIRDCTMAIALNPDSAQAYKYRGKAYRLLGKFLEAAKDLRTACKIDFDEESNEWLKELTPNAKKLEEHERKKIRIKGEKELKERKERIKKAKEANARAAAAAATATTDDSPSLGGFEDLFKDPDLTAAFSDPEVAAAFLDVTSNRANIAKYQNNPKIMNLINKMASKVGGGMPGMPSAFNIPKAPSSDDLD